jgi:Alginate lyase
MLDRQPAALAGDVGRHGSLRTTVRSLLVGLALAAVVPIALGACEGGSTQSDRGPPGRRAAPLRTPASACPSSTAGNASPHLYGIDPAIWASDQRKAWADKGWDALATLKNDAKKAMGAGPWTVTASPTLAPDGNPHQYVTLSRYWWPDPTTPDRLPYVRHDGRTDPLVASYPDEGYLDKTVDTASTLTHAYSLLGDQAAARRAALLIRTFFLNSATAMAPDATYGQLVPGQTAVRGDGVLDTRGLIRLVDDLTLLNGSPAWTSADNRAMTQWLSSFLEWLQTSPVGQAAAAEPNNHGTWYDAEMASLSLYLGHTQTAQTVVDHYVTDKEGKQILPNGGEPLELTRTNSWDYSTFNLDGAMILALDARDLGTDLFNCTPTDGGSIADAVGYLLPYATGVQSWPHPESGNLDLSRAVFSVAMAATTFGDPTAAAALDHIPSGAQSKMDGLLPPNLSLIGHTA